MSEPKFRPGPYVAVEDIEGRWFVHACDLPEDRRVPLAVVDHSRDGYAPAKARSEFDAKLFAAAPDLYAALELAIACLENARPGAFDNGVTDPMGQGDEGATKTAQAVHSMRAALASARGEGS